MSYYDPEELPIDVAATDPLDGDLIFGMEDKPDELRNKFNYEEPIAPGRNRINKEAAATKTQLDRLARNIQAHVPQSVGPRFARFIARTQAAMQLGVGKQQLLDWFYGGMSEVDPFRIAAAGYAAEARWFAAEDQPRDVADDTARDFTPDFLQDQPQEEVEEALTDSPHIEAEPAGELDLDLDIEPAGESLDGDAGLHADMLPVAASINGDDRDYSWLDPILADVTNPLPAVGGSPTELKPDDEVESNTGLQGKVVNVQPDGSFTTRWLGGTGNAQQTTYNQKALETGEVKRKDTGTVSTIPALPAPTS